ncbi:MAG: NAD(P)-dependent oxidoreductase [Candidatus Fermentibacteraceae bacterium]|nr:NAD(P)-dependent oxidoreductase [Candidatus Fermentibacteraceae bacterium]
MKTIVLGAGGMLGTDLVPFWNSRTETVPLTHRECDISSRSSVAGVFTREKPELVLLLAAATDVDRCQIDHRYAYSTNSAGAEIVAQAVELSGAAMVYISSIAVFNGEKNSPYDEYDIPSPLNTYGLSKFHGEQAIRTFCHRHWIVRTGWLFGGGARDMKFVARILRKVSLDHEIKVVRDCVGSPTYTGDLAEGIFNLTQNFQYGTYHMVNGGVPASRYELARETVSIAGHSPNIIQPCLSSDFNLPAPRPRMEAAHSMKLILGDNPVTLPDWKHSLKGYINNTLGELLS